MVTFRRLADTEEDLLETFLYLAIHQEDPTNPVSRSVLELPELATYISNWGRRSDHCLVAEVGGVVIGAAWCRIYAGQVTGYGFVDDQTPELTMSLLPEYRGRGIGSELLGRLLELLQEKGLRAGFPVLPSIKSCLSSLPTNGFRDPPPWRRDAVMVIELEKSQRTGSNWGGSGPGNTSRT